MDVYLSTPKEWRKSEKAKLFNAVREDAIRKRLRNTNQEKEIVSIRLNNRYTDESERKELANKLKEIIARESAVRVKSDIELLGDLSEEFSWLEISMQTFEGYYSEKSCRLMWQNVMHPSINKGHWTKKEDQLLKQLADKKMSENQGFANWDDIASEMGNGRTSFHCFMRYQQKHNSFLDRRKWSYDEDERLKQLVSQCRINKHFVPWPKVSYYMSNRTKDQCYQRYVYSLQSHLRKGVFTENEDFVILIGVNLFSHNWAKISEYLPNRTPIQIHSRFNTFLNVNFKSWSQEEDLKLLQLVKEKGYRVWAEIAKSFQDRTRSQCRNRFYIIYKMFQLQPNSFDLNKMKYRSQEEVTLQGRRQKTLYDNLKKKVNIFLAQRKINIAEKGVNKRRQKTMKRKRASKRNKKETSDILEHANPSLNLQISDEDSDSDLNSEDEFEIDLDNQFQTTLSKKAASNSIEDPVTSYHVTPEGTKIPRRYLLEFMHCLQNELLSKGASLEGGYEKKEFQRIAKPYKTDSGSCKQYGNPMPMKHMSAFVSTNKKGVPITTFKGNIGRPGAVQNTACKQALTDRSLAIYFRPSWPGRVGKPVGSYKMVKSQQDQLRQALAAVNFYGQLIQVYPKDLKHRVYLTAIPTVGDQSRTCSDELLELFISQQNENLFCHKSLTQSSNEDVHSEREVDGSKSCLKTSSLKSCNNKSTSNINTDLSSQSMTRQTPIRTYSRKRNIPVVNSNKPQSEGLLTHKVYKAEKRSFRHNPDTRKFIQFVPSNNHTLVGFRGLLLQLRTLKSVVRPDGTGVRISLDRIVQEGVHHIDLFSDQKEAHNPAEESLSEKRIYDPNQKSKYWSGGGETEIWGQKKLTPHDADKLLIDRFLSIYFWPAQMSAVRPPPLENIFESKRIDATNKYTSHENGFDGSFSGHPIGPNYNTKYTGLMVGKETVAAAQPFDASKIIEAAKIRAATTPQRRIIVVPRGSNETGGLAVPKLEPGINSQKVTNDVSSIDACDQSITVKKW